MAARVHPLPSNLPPRVQPQQPRKRRQRPAVDEQDEKGVIDWLSEPSLAIAQDFRQLHRPAFMVSETSHRMPASRSLCKLDAAGRWPTTSGVQPYSVWAVGTTGSADLAAIGGVGMRQYYLVLKALSLLCLTFWVISLPALAVYSNSDLYEHPSAQRFQAALGVRLTLGNLQTSDADADAGRAGALWVASITNAVVCLGGSFFALWCGKYMGAVARDCDAHTVTMADYSVQITPVGRGAWTKFRVGSGATKEQQAAQLTDEVCKALAERLGQSQQQKDSAATSSGGGGGGSGGGGQQLIAVIGGRPAVWIAWNEAVLIELWRQKSRLLFDLEAALRTRSQTQDDTDVERVLTKIEAGNAEIQQLVDGGKWLPVCLFATFESDDMYTKCLSGRKPELIVGGQRCRITPAAEPETLLWSHLEYSKSSRCGKRTPFCALCSTFHFAKTGSGQNVSKK
jgi:hypothetical protein